MEEHDDQKLVYKPLYIATMRGAGKIAPHGCAVVYLSVMIIVQKTIGEFAHELMKKSWKKCKLYYTSTHALL